MMSIDVDDSITFDRIEAMETFFYDDFKSAIVGCALENDERFFTFYVDGWVEVIERDDVSSELWDLILDAASKGYALDYLSQHHASWVTDDVDKIAVAYFDYLSNQW